MRILGSLIVGGALVLGHWAQAQETGPGLCLNFPGRDTVVAVPHHERFNTYPLSVTLWMRSAQQDGSAGLVSKYASGAHCGWQVYLLNGNVRAWYFVNVTNCVWDGADGLNGGPVADNRWHHLAFTVGPNGGRLYVDGVLRDSRPWTGRPGPSPATHPVTLGSYPGTAPAFFRGQLDEVTLWDRPLSAGDIAGRRFFSHRGDEPGLIAYYRMDEAEGPLIFDAAQAMESPGRLVGSIFRGPSEAPLRPEIPVDGLPMVVRRQGGPEVEAGTPVEFEVEFPGEDEEVVWTRNGAVLSGAAQRQLLIPSVTPDDAGDYRAEIHRDGTTLTSPPAPLRVLATPRWAAIPVGTIADPGAVVELDAHAAGGRPLTWDWYRDDRFVGSGSGPVLRRSPFRFEDAGVYRVVARNAFGAITSASVAVRISAVAITNGLVVHLPFDGDLQDRSGRGNHAVYTRAGSRARENPSFVAGRLGRAFQYTTRTDGTAFEYATLGYPPDLQFDGSADFSVSFWTSFRENNGDLPFISNKDWYRSHHTGWAIAMQSRGTLRVNLTGPAAGADFVTAANTPVLRGGNWRHVLVSVQRAGAGLESWVTLYVDGRPVQRIAQGLTGSVDTASLPFAHHSPASTPQTGWAVNIGQDGTGVYYDLGGAGVTDARIDDLGIWRRALTDAEATAIHAAGVAGLDLSRAAVPARLFIVESGSEAELFWPGAPRADLESRPALDSPDWLPVPLSGPANAVQVPVSGLPGFFRLRGAD